MEFLTEFVPNAAIVVLCCLAGMLLKWAFEGNERLTAGIPWMLGVLGAILGAVSLAIIPEDGAGDVFTQIALGVVSGLAACGANQIVRQQEKLKNGD